MKKYSLLFIPLFALLGCQPTTGDSENGGGVREAASEAVNAPANYVDANMRARQQAMVTSATSSVNNAIRMFEVSEGRKPSSINELTQEGYLSQLPELPKGASYDYDAQSGNLTISGY